MSVTNIFLKLCLLIYYPEFKIPLIWLNYVQINKPQRNDYSIPIPRFIIWKEENVLFYHAMYIPPPPLKSLILTFFCSSCYSLVLSSFWFTNLWYNFWWHQEWDLELNTAIRLFNTKEFWPMIIYREGTITNRLGLWDVQPETTTPRPQSIE